MSFSLQQLAEQVGARVHGDADVQIRGVADLVEAGEGDIGFVALDKFKSLLSDTGASAVILREDLLEACPTSALVCDNPLATFARVATLLTKEPAHAGGKHDSAVVADSAQLAEGVWVGPRAVIEDDVVLGRGVQIGAGCVVGKGSVIGADSELLANVTVYHHSVIGERCLIHSGAVIGSDGFGNANDQGRWIKIPQLGRTVIGNDVEIGANTAIDRGAMKDTVIGDGVRIDNLVHIAHNVCIGDNTAIAACVGIAGSTTIGKGVTIGGVSGVADHIQITDNAHFTGMAMVTRSITEPGVYSSGLPAEPNREWRKNVVRVRNLDKLEKRLKALESKLDEK